MIRERKTRSSGWSYLPLSALALVQLILRGKEQGTGGKLEKRERWPLVPASEPPSLQAGWQVGRNEGGQLAS